MTALKLFSGAGLAAVLLVGAQAQAQPRDLPSSAELMEAGPGAPAYVAATDSSAHFPSPASAWLGEGRFVSPWNIRRVAPGMTKPQLYSLLGEPHFYTPLPYVRTWNYIFDFYTGQGDAFVQCQYQVRFDGAARVKAAFWKDASCMRFVADPPPQSQPLPPPPPPAPLAQTAPPPAPMQRQEFVVYFPFDSAEITTAASSVIRSVADYDHGAPGPHAVVVGFTDTSGSARYNLALSKKRARAVADALVADGVAGASLDVSWKGKTDLAVPTADGVREPLNRRSTIVVEPAL